MGELLKTFLDFVERFPILAWRMGLSCAGLGATVYGAIWSGFIRHEAFSGYAEDGARLAIAIGAGFFVIGTIFANGASGSPYGLIFKSRSAALCVQSGGVFTCIEPAIFVSA